MSIYCQRYADDSPGIRRDCEAHLAAKRKCVDCPHRDIRSEVKDLRGAVHGQEMRELLKEAIKIIHCHLRNLHKDWLTRARRAVSRNVDG